MKFEHENDYLKTLLSICLQIQRDPVTTTGICSNVSNALRLIVWDLSEEMQGTLQDEFEALLTIFFETWPKFSGNIAFPVPDFRSDWDRYSRAGVIFWECYDYWSGEYGDLRKELLQFMIDSLKLALKTK